jgi:hypothetical protein
MSRSSELPDGIEASTISKTDRKTDHGRTAQPGKHFGHAAADGTDNISGRCR